MQTSLTPASNKRAATIPQQPITADALATLRVMRGTGYGPELAAVIVAAAGLGSREARANGRA